MPSPTFETPRLSLRPVARADLDALHALWTEPAVRRHLWDDEVISRERAAATVEDAVVSFAQHGFGMWTVWLRTGGALAGFCGLRAVPGSADPELVYGIAPACSGQGLATEAVAAVLRWAFEECGLEQVVGMTDPPNVASMRVMENAGMVRDSAASDGGLVRYVALRQSWRRPGLTARRDRA